ncbi:MAG: protease [candidate division Zixibacteria bacterium]|nr:protease [candidate division Zixibacteria bacterium]
MIRIFAVLLILLTVAGAQADEARLLRFPDIHRDKLAFSYGGDIYLASRDGGEAIRLTSHEGMELFAKFSPDGKFIAFTGQYDGDMAVYTIPASGGEPKRLTYHPGIQRTSERFGPENVVMDWHPDGEQILFRSRKEVNDWWDGRVYLVSIEGGLPEPLPMAVAGFTSLSPDLSRVAYCPIYRDFRTWKRYKGGMAQDVWIFDLDELKGEKITSWEGTDNMPMWYRDKIYFNSDRTDVLNIYCYDLISQQIRQVTSFSDYDVRWPSLGPDGIIFEKGGFLYVMDLPSENIHKVEIELITDLHSTRTEYIDVSDKIRDFDISPDAKRAVFSARGEIFTVPQKEGNTRNLTNSSGANDREPAWSPDGRWIAYISDEAGEEEFYIVSHDGKEKIRLTGDGYCHRFAARWSPDSKKLAFSDKELNFYILDIDSRKLKGIDQATRNDIRDFSWSPDSRYIAYTKKGEDDINRIFVYSTDDKDIHQVTPGFTNDFSPVFDPNGKYLYFLSQRDFNPILGNYEFSFINHSITNLFLIILSADEKSPFAPESDEVKIGDEDKSSEEDDDRDRKIKEVEIDFDGIYQRQVAFDLKAGNYRGLTATKDALFYVSHPIYGMKGKVGDDESILHKFDMKEEKSYELASGIRSWKITPDGERMLLWKKGNFFLTGTSGEKANLDEKLDLSRMEMRLDREAEYKQMFHEVWRMQRDFFYDPNMHGVDWDAMRDKYELWLPHVTHRYDFTYLIGEMIGELACSHTYVGGGDYERTQSSEIGLFGVDFEINEKNNRLKISRILKGENWEEDLRSPLFEPGVGIQPGDYLLAINGHEITAADNPYSFTENTVGEIVTLTVSGKPDFKSSREVEIKPIPSEESLRYYNWVEDRRSKVDSISDGEIGYIHIPDMDSYGLYRFTKMFYHQLRKPGLIVDVRYNGGGFVSGLILERLRREVVAMGASRTYDVGRAPGQGIHAHMVTLLNEFSCSDGDYLPYFFRQYELGPLMGKRSWGGVIGITGYRPLIDGGYYTVPQFGIYSLEGEWIMENVGVRPDIEVDNYPGRMAQGYDDQLDSAIDHIKRKLKENPKELPPRPPAPEER